MKKLNLGCGKDYREGWINIDFNKNINADIYHNLDIFPYPFEKDTFEFVKARSIFEHVMFPNFLLNELVRICKDGAIIEIVTEHFTSYNLWSSLEHKRGFNLSSFRNEKNIKQIKYRLNIPLRFFFIKPIVKYFPLFYEKYLAYIFPATHIESTLRVEKE